MPYHSDSRDFNDHGDGFRRGRAYSKSVHNETAALQKGVALSLEESVKASLQVVAPVIHRYQALPHPFRIAALVHEKERGFWKLSAWDRAMNGEHAEERLMNRAGTQAEGATVITFVAIPGGFIRSVAQNFCHDCLSILIEHKVARLIIYHRDGWISYSVNKDTVLLGERISRNNGNDDDNDDDDDDGEYEVINGEEYEKPKIRDHTTGP